MSPSIIIDTTHLGSSQPTGVEVYAEELVPRLSAVLIQKGCQVTWVGHAKTAPSSLPSGVGYVASPHSSWWSQRGLLKLLHEKKPDMFFTPSGIPPIRYGGKTAFTVHDVAVYRYPAAYSLGQRFRLRWLSKRAAKRSQLMVTPSDYTKKELVKMWHLPESRVSVVPLALPAISNEVEPVDIPTDLPIILSIGRIELKKNLLPLIHAFAKLSTPARLVLAGKDGFGASSIRGEIEQLPQSVRERILLPGFISDGQKQVLLTRAQILAVPCLIEGFGFPVLEGFAARVPVLCSRSGSLPEVGGDAVEYVSDANQWASRLDRLLTDESLRTQLIERGARRLQMFSWEQTSMETAEKILEACT